MIADLDARNQARKNLSANIVVEAGAGTGKTTLLTDRLLFLLLAGGPEKEGLPLSRLVALTFTEKAAGEIKLRLAERLTDILDALAGRPTNDPSRARTVLWLNEAEAEFKRTPDAIRKMAEDAFAELDRASISTIHHFAATLLRLYPVESGVAPQFRVDEGAAFEALFRREWDLWLEEELGETAPRAALWTDLLPRVPPQDLEALAKAMCRGEAAEESPALGVRLKKLLEALRLVPADKPKPKGNSKILDSIVRVTATLDSILAAPPDPEAPLPAPALPEDFTPRTWPKAWEALPGEDLYLEALAVAKSTGVHQRALVAKARKALAPFVQRFRARYEREGNLGFDDLLRLARRLLAGHKDVRHGLKDQFAAILVDEFQDTDPQQGEILFFLAEAAESEADRWDEATLAPGKLFIVGDPKQSIYRFRGADIRAYQSFVDAVLAQDGVKCDLQTNFRSHAGLVEPMNALFGEMMKENPGFQPAYLPLRPRPEPATPGDLPTPELVLVNEGPGRLSARQVQKAEARWITRWIVENCARGPFQPKDVALLFRSTSALGVYLDVFKAAGVPYLVESDRSFYSAPEVVDLLNLLRLLDNPDDAVALTGVLRSPLVLLEDAHLRVLAENGALDFRRDPPPVLPADVRARLSAAFEVWRGLQPSAGRLALGAFVERVLRETYFLEIAAAAYHGEQTVSNLLKLVRLAEEAGASQGFSLVAFLRLARGYVRDAVEEGESPLAEAHVDAVRLLTIHKAKGLEYPVVFLPNLSAERRGRGQDKPVMRRDWRARDVGHRLTRAKAADLPMAFLELDEAKREDFEAVRLLYVAATRAREKLFLLGRGGEKGKSDFLSRVRKAAETTDGPWRLPGGHTLPVTAVDAEPPEPPRWPHAPAPSPAQDLKALSALWEKRRRAMEEVQTKPRILRPSGLEKTETPAAPGPRGENRAARVGQICHAVLETWDFWNASELPDLIAAAVAALAADAPAADWSAAASEAREVLHHFSQTAAARELAKTEVLGREMPFLFNRDGAVVRGDLDILFRRGGMLWVGDYKTDKLAPGGAGERAQGYRAQGQAYVDAVSRALGEPCGFEVIFLRTGERVEILPPQKS